MDQKEIAEKKLQLIDQEYNNIKGIREDLEGI